MAENIEKLVGEAVESLQKFKGDYTEQSQKNNDRIKAIEDNLASVSKKSDLEAIMTDIKSLREDLNGMATKKPKEDPRLIKSMAEHLEEAFNQPEIKAALEKQARKESATVSVSMNYKDVGPMTIANNLTGSTGVPTYQPGIVPAPSEPLHLRQIIGVFPSATDNYHFIRHNESIGEGAFAYQTNELSAKAQVDYDFTDVTVTLNPLAAYLKVSRKMLRNVPALAAYLGQYLPEQYLQAEDDQGYTAFNTVSGKTTGSTAGNWDGILETIGLVEDQKYSVNGIVVKPSVYYTLLAYKGSTYDYNMPGVVTMENGVMRVNGIPVFKATWVPDDTALIGDWRTFKIIQSEALSVRSTDTDQDDFIKNRITYLCECVQGFAIERPAALSEIDLGFSS